MLNSSRENQSELSKYREVLRRRATPAEIRLKCLLDELGERYLFQKGFFNKTKFYIVDFYLPKRRKLCLEVDGGYHDLNRRYDSERERFLRDERGFRLLRVSNELVFDIDSKQLSSMIA